jgi:hypothetical protein
VTEACANKHLGYFGEVGPSIAWTHGDEGWIIMAVGVTCSVAVVVYQVLLLFGSELFILAAWVWTQTWPSYLFKSGTNR